MQLAKIRRKARVVKKKFHEIWKIAVDLGEFEARRRDRCGARAVGADAQRGARWGARGAGQARRGRWAATRLVRWRAGRRGGCRARWCAGRRRVRGDEESCRVQARRGAGRGAGRHAGRQGGGARRRGEHCRAQARRGHGERDCGTGTACGTGRRGENHASSPHPSNEPPKARSFSYPDGISDESDAFWAFMRFAAAQFDQSQAKSPSPAPNPAHSHPFCRIAECGPDDLDEGEA